MEADEDPPGDRTQHHRAGGPLQARAAGGAVSPKRMDGSGYPQGLAGEAIPIEARIVAVADTYDVLTSDRHYRKACDPRDGRRVVRQEAGSHLDPTVVEALLRTLDIRASSPRELGPAFAP